MLLNTPICDFGRKAPTFSLREPLTEKTYTLEEELGPKGLLIMFICNHCPYVQRIAEQLAKDTKILKEEGLNILAIMSNDYREYEEDSPEKMLHFKEKYHFQFPYLLDEDQSVGKAYGAVCTPDFFGFNHKGELQYRGNNEGLLEGMRLIAQTGFGPKEQTPSMGCSIKWKK